MVLSPGALEGAPATWVATARVPAAAEPALQNAVVAAFPNVTAIPVRDVLERVAGVLGEIAVAVRLVALFTLGTGLVVMAGALAATRSQRLYESVVLRTLGATRGVVARAFAVEYGLLGAAAGVGGRTAGHGPGLGRRALGPRCAVDASTPPRSCSASPPRSRWRSRSVFWQRSACWARSRFRCFAVNSAAPWRARRIAMFTPLGLDHVVLRVADQAASQRFYVDVLGCTVDHVNERISLVHLRFGEHYIDLLPATASEPARSPVASITSACRSSATTSPRPRTSCAGGA